MNYEDLKNIKIFKINRLDASANYESNTIKVDLNGTWYFKYAKNLKEAKDGLYYTNCNVEDLDIILVPGHIQMQGYDTPQYVNVQYPWDGVEQLSPPNPPEKFNPVATYVKEFTSVTKKHTTIVFEGVESSLALWCNGNFIGYSEDSFSTATFDLTKYLKKENRIVVQVFKWCSGSYLEDQDFFRFSGIFRDVYLEKKTIFHSKDLKYEGTLINNYQDGLLKLDLSFYKDYIKEITITVKDEHKKVFQKTYKVIKDLKKEIKIKDIKPWSAEIPNLYFLTIEIENIEIIKEKVGFRKLEMINNIYHINGKRLVFNGVNRHEWSCYKGRAINIDDIYKDLKIMKKHNINAIRTSHYPNNKEFYKLCDLFGFYVINETNLETHGAWLNCHNPMNDLPNSAVNYIPGNNLDYLDILLDRVNSMYQRDKNRCSIIMWSLGNESLGGEVIYKMGQFLKEQDNSRIIHYEGEVFDKSFPISDIV